MRPDSPLLERVAHDANNLSDPPQRRLNMSMVDDGRRKLRLLDAVTDEVGRCVRSSEIRRWSQALHARQVSIVAQGRIIEAVGDAAQRWFMAEIDRPGGLFERVPLTEDQKLAALELTIAMPWEFFTGRNGPNQDTDRAMVAESAVAGCTLLLTEDQSTIRHEAVNRWLEGNNWTDAPVLLQANTAAHQRLERDAGERALYEWMLGAYLPVQPSVRDAEIIDCNARQLERAGMRYAGMRVLQELHADPNPEATFARVRADLPQRARDAEARRLESVRQAASTAGFPSD